MKKAYRLRMPAVFVLLSVLILYAGNASAGFYVIPVKTGSKNTVTISHTGSDTENGAALLAALEKITDASDSNRYLIVIEPGTYDIGSTPLQMRQYISISGWGMDETVITGSVAASTNPPDAGMVMGADNAELTRLTVRNTGVGLLVVAVYNNNVSGSFEMTCVTAAASGGFAL